MTLLPAHCLEGEAAHGAEEEEDECEQTDTTISMQGKFVGICLHTRRKLTVEKSILWPCILNFLFCYKALILRFPFPSLIKSEFKAEPEAQDTSCYPASCFISRVVLLVGLNRITSHFPVRISVIGFSQLPSRSSGAGYL